MNVGNIIEGNDYCLHRHVLISLNVEKWASETHIWEGVAGKQDDTCVDLQNREKMLLLVDALSLANSHCLLREVIWVVWCKEIIAVVNCDITWGEGIIRWSTTIVRLKYKALHIKDLVFRDKHSAKWEVSIDVDNKT